MKTVKEISVKLENRPGTLSKVSELLAADGINIVALVVGTEGPTGTLSFIATDPARVVNVLHSAGYSPSVREIIAVETPQHPGGLNAVLKSLRLAKVNIEYLYTCVDPHVARNRTIIMLGVDDTARAYDALTREWINLYGDELYNY